MAAAGGAEFTLGLVLAWRNLVHRWLAAGLTLSGFVLVIALIAIQLGLLDAGKRLVTSVFDLFDFDLILVSSDYQFLYSAPGFDRMRLVQARSIPGVDAVTPVNLDTRRWLDLDTRRESSMILIGVDAQSDFVRDHAMRAALRALHKPGGIVIDRLSHSDYGPLDTGVQGEVSGQRLTIRGQFDLGMFFYAEGSGLVDNRDFEIVTGGGGRSTSMGLVRLQPGQDAQQVRDALQAALPDDVQVLTRQAMLERERHYFVSVKPLGILFQTGTLTAFVVGFVVLLHLVSAIVGSQASEFATLKALGFPRSSVYGFGIWQLLMVGLAGFVLALLLADRVFGFIASQVPLPVRLDSGLAGQLALMSVGMIVPPLWVALHRIGRQDPVRLFR